MKSKPWKTLITICAFIFINSCTSSYPTAHDLLSSTTSTQLNYKANLQKCMTGQALFCNFNALTTVDKLNVVNAKPFTSNSQHDSKNLDLKNTTKKESIVPITKTPTSLGIKKLLPNYNNTPCAETSCYGDISTLTGRPKTHYVNGYYRKNGTYVSSYYRS